MHRRCYQLQRHPRFWNRFRNQPLMISLETIAPVAIRASWCSSLEEVWRNYSSGFLTFSSASAQGSWGVISLAAALRPHLQLPFLLPLESAKLVSALGLRPVFSLPGTFSPSPFPVLSDLGTAAPHCASSATTSWEKCSLTILSQAPPFPRAPYLAFLYLGPSSTPQDTEED